MSEPIFEGQSFTVVQFEDMKHAEILGADPLNNYPSQPRFLRLWWNIVRCWEAIVTLTTTATSAATTASSAAGTATTKAAEAASSAAAAATFDPALYVAKAGSTMSGHLNVPAGASGSQVMRASEVSTAISTAISNLINSAPGALDTLDELAAALGDDANFASTVMTALAGKQGLNATLTALAGLTTAPDKLFYASDVDTFASTEFTAFARTLLDDANAAAVRSTLGITNTGARNPINNGEILLAQSGNSFAFAAGTSGLTVDGWGLFQAGAAAGTVSQSIDVPNDTFQNSLRYTVTTADASIAATDRVTMQAIVEGYNVRRFIGKDTAVSFWVRSSVTGIHCVAFQNTGADRSFVREITINAANTWEKKTVTIPSGLITAGTWDWTTGVGLYAVFTLAAGSTFQGAADSWQSSKIFATANQVNAVGSIGNIFAVTGLRFEEGLIASDFEHLPFSEVVRQAERYYEKSFNLTTAPAQNAGAGSANFTGMVSNARHSVHIPFRSRKRAAPTVVTYSPNGANANWLTNASVTPIAAVINIIEESMRLVATNPVGLGADYSINWTADARLPNIT